MSIHLSTSGYDRVILIDTQVVLETKPLDQLPWSELGQGPILLLVAGQVQKEIDGKKGDGRLGERSRAFNRLLDTFLDTGRPAVIRAEDPKVDVALMLNSAIDWTLLDDLDRDAPDDRIVAQGLNALVDDRSRLEILSHDMRPRHAASSHGMPAVKLPEHWLRPPAQTPEQRDVARLQQQLKIATADQPRLEVELTPMGSAVLLWSLTSLAIDLFEHRLVFRDFWQDWLIASGAIAFCLIAGRFIAVPVGAQVDAPLVIQIAMTILLFPMATRLVAWIDRKRGRNEVGV